MATVRAIISALSGDEALINTTARDLDEATSTINEFIVVVVTRESCPCCSVSVG